MPRPRKVVLLGDFGVGKTSFGTRLAKGEFHESTLATLGVAHFNVAVRAAGDGPLAPAVKLEIWDTAGQERYRSMDTLKLYLRGAAGAIIVARALVPHKQLAFAHSATIIEDDELVLRLTAVRKGVMLVQPTIKLQCSDRYGSFPPARPPVPLATNPDVTATPDYQFSTQRSTNVEPLRSCLRAISVMSWPSPYGHSPY